MLPDQVAHRAWFAHSSRISTNTPDSAPKSALKPCHPTFPASQISPIRFADHFPLPAHTGSGIAPDRTPAAADYIRRSRILYREFLWFLRHFVNNPLQSKILQDWGEEDEDSFIENKGVLSQNRAGVIP